MQIEVHYPPKGQERWNFYIPKDRRLTPQEVADAGEDLFHDFMGPRKSREGFMMNADPHDLAYRLLYLVKEDKYKRRIAASISAATEALDGVVRKDGLPHLRHVLRVGLRTTYRLLDLHGKLTDADIEKIEAMINHDTREDARKERSMTSMEIQELWTRHSDREKINGNFLRQRRRNARIYKIVTVFDQNDKNGEKNPQSDQALKNIGLSSEKMSDDTLDSLLGDISWASRLLRQKDPSATAEEINAIYLLLAGSNDKRKKGSVHKTEQRRNFFNDQLTDYDHNQIAIYLSAANKIVHTLETKLRELTPGFVSHPQRKSITTHV